jgi:AcrR family transcriptional regulator
MGAPETKQKILNASLALFNEYGISNVRLQQIADETGISVGNLAYHFANKEAITRNLIAGVTASLQDLLKQYGKYASLHDLNFFFREFYRICAQYPFFNVDILEIKRNYPESYESAQPLFNKVRLQLERRFDLCLQQRLMQSGVNLKNMVSSLWILMFFTPAESQVNGRKNANAENLYLRRLWNYILPYFTAKGTDEYSSSIEPEFTGR